MADQFATPGDLASLLQQDVDTSTAVLLIECATSVVQATAGGQRIIRVVDDPMSIMGLSDSWLNLPQIPVTAVGAVTLDGVTLVLGTDYKVFGDRLWSKTGWQNNLGWPTTSQSGVISNTWDGPEPSAVTVVCTHGYAAGAWQLQSARNAALALAKVCYPNPSGATAMSIDDYSAAYEAMSARMEASPFLQAALRKQYGRRAGLVRAG